MHRKFQIHTIVLSVLLFSSFALFAQAEEQFVAGKHYQLLDQPVRTRDASKVEVVEVFWYGCSHCYSFEPLAKQWKKRQSDDVDFWQSPAIWNSAMETHARMFYTAKSLNIFDKIHEPIFALMNVERKRLTDTDDIEDVFSDFGVDREEFRKTFKSFSVNSQVKQANARARSYKISGTPELVVNGKYRVSGREAGGQTEMLQVVDFLINKERENLTSQ